MSRKSRKKAPRQKRGATKREKVKVDPALPKVVAVTPKVPQKATPKRKPRARATPKAPKPKPEPEKVPPKPKPRKNKRKKAVSDSSERRQKIPKATESKPKPKSLSSSEPTESAKRKPLKRRPVESDSESSERPAKMTPKPKRRLRSGSSDSDDYVRSHIVEQHEAGILVDQLTFEKSVGLDIMAIPHSNRTCNRAAPTFYHLLSVNDSHKGIQRG